jgi:hypothetical protein
MPGLADDGKVTCVYHPELTPWLDFPNVELDARMSGHGLLIPWRPPSDDDQQLVFLDGSMATSMGRHTTRCLDLAPNGHDPRRAERLLLDEDRKL